ncbi:Stp1/IreP family PP2C-type Ser/Thr phosphatase [Paenibacillus sp. B01]|uniref:Stp1/IreP family PP2C-type Ser/Thr phosphatase n=1 Tax=Paenibacillus sp. B01 TaxID=2660554 RepID=UPI00129B2DE2|nr:Stp1/IreP family PP2C-type Ser/Thr phosphatase [Paenibacillus sp. B01]QGG56771.1 Stp1/IreP family PP2C-type Ser/Thr phosphatase [Paenibacillus sp. B01]
MLTVNRSDIGRIRMANEDRSWAGVTAGGLTLAIVADGMGGHQAGDVASQLAVDAFREAMEPLPAGVSADEAGRMLQEAIRRANEVVYDMASRNEQYHNMGTTVVAALFVEETRLILGHIGDSRAYRISEQGIAQLTEDHTLVNELVRSGQISFEEAAHHPRRNVLTRALGTDEEVELDVRMLDWQPGDILLLCSDGLSGMLDDSELLQVAGDAGESLEAKADRLISLALAAGGDDNITVVLMQSGAATDGEE